MVNDCCPKIAHDKRRARQRYARYLKRRERLEYLRKLIEGGIDIRNGYGITDPTPPEAVKLIKAEINKLSAK